MNFLNNHNFFFISKTFTSYSYTNFTVFYGPQGKKRTLKYFNKKMCYNRSVRIYDNSQDAILELQKTKYMAPILIFLIFLNIKE